jgi:hypothetical protein
MGERPGTEHRQRANSGSLAISPEDFLRLFVPRLRGAEISSGFGTDLGEMALAPGTGGVFKITLRRHDDLGA